jgi:hypothetical protein
MVLSAKSSSTGPMYHDNDGHSEAPRTARSNTRVLQPGGAAGRMLTRLEGAVSTSLIHAAAGEGVARSRRANR